MADCDITIATWISPSTGRRIRENIITHQRCVVFINQCSVRSVMPAELSELIPANAEYLSYEDYIRKYRGVTIPNPCVEDDADIKRGTGVWALSGLVLLISSIYYYKKKRR